MMASLTVLGVAQAGATTLFQVQVGASEALETAQNVTIDGVNHDTEQAGGIVLKNLSTSALITTVCLDVNANAATTLYEEIPFAGNAGLNPVWGNPLVDPSTAASLAVALRAVQNAAQIYGVNAPLAGTSALKWTAIQLAVWEAIYDTQAAPGNLNLNTGRFTVANSAAKTLAAGELVDGNYNISGNILVPVETDIHGNAVLDAFGNPIPDSADQEFLIDVTPVPEPSTVIAGVLLLLPFGASTLRFMRKSRTA
jgi:hypothetical protein